MYMHNSNCLHIIRMYWPMHQIGLATITPAATTNLGSKSR